MPLAYQHVLNLPKTCNPVILSKKVRFNTLLLLRLILCIVQLVKVSVDAVQLRVFIEVRLKVFDCCGLAHRLAYTCYDQPMEDIVFNLIKPGQQHGADLCFCQGFVH